VSVAVYCGPGPCKSCPVELGGDYSLLTSSLKDNFNFKIEILRFGAVLLEKCIFVWFVL